MLARVGKVALAAALVVGPVRAGAEDLMGKAPWPGPALISPGGLGNEGLVRSGCPTFSWAALAAASGYELVVYEVSAGGAASRVPAAHPVLRAALPAGASSFTPEAGACLAAGRYGWAVGAEVGDGTHWSRPALFRVEPESAPKAPPPAPPREESGPRAILTAPAAAPSAAGGEPRGGPPVRALTGEAFAPPLCSVGDEMFDDVPASDPFCRWVEQLVRDGIAGTCGTGRYCPDLPVTRRQLARYLERAMRGTANWAPAQGAHVLAPPADNATWTVDFSSSDDGMDSSITIGADGLPIVSYYDNSHAALKVAHCNDVACAGNDETITTVDDPLNSDVGRHSSIAIGRDGRPIISYHDASAPALKVVQCNDVACAGQDETITTVDDTPGVGTGTSIAIGSDGLPVISYYDPGALALKVAHCNDTACAGQNETITTVHVGQAIGNNTSIAIGSDGLPIISHESGMVRSLKVTHCDDVACSGQGETSTSVVLFFENDCALDTAITIGTDGLPIVSFQDCLDGSLMVVQCNDLQCTGQNETVSFVDSVGGVGSHNSITIGADGLPIVSYHDAEAGALKVAHCNDIACAGQNETLTTVFDPAADVGESTAITIGVDGLPIISHYDRTNGNLKVTHCSNVFCTPYFRRR